GWNDELLRRYGGRMGVRAFADRRNCGRRYLALPAQIAALSPIEGYEKRLTDERLTSAPDSRAPGARAHRPPSESMLIGKGSDAKISGLWVFSRYTCQGYTVVCNFAGAPSRTVTTAFSRSSIE